MNGGPLVTAITISYNHARWVATCLDAIRAQTYGNIELIILDDRSPDDSAAVIRRWIEEHGVACTFIPHEVNRGLCATLNEAITLARGKYIAFLAADDLWLPEKIERDVALIESLPADVGVIYGDAFVIDEEGRRLEERFIAAHGGPVTPPGGRIFDELMARNFIPVAATLIRRECFERVGLYDESLVYEDWDMWLRIAERFSFAYSDRITACYRIVGSSMIRTMSARMMETNIGIYRKYLGRDPRTDAMLKGRIAKAAEVIYKSGSPRSAEYLRLALRYQRGLRMLLFYGLAASGITYSRFSGLKRSVRTFLGRA
ncbi:MAG: glycosyltransferase [Chlorobi bacterium]|nr:glycosyltransferase [Chlorobiota bacterium]